MTEGDQEPTIFDEAFVAAAPVREAEPLPKPSRESLREVKREARQRARGVVHTTVVPIGAARRRRRTGRLRQRLAVAGMALAALAGAALLVARLPGPPHKTRTAPIVVPSYTPPPRPRPTSPGDVFAGSKVARWPVGAAGIKAPAATAVGGYRVAAVADAYARTAAYARAALLDRSVLYGRATEPVLGMLRPGSVTEVRRDLAGVMTRFDPARVAPGGTDVRVNGRMLAKPGPDGTLRVDLTYVAVYPLRPAARKDAVPELVAVRRVVTLEFQHGRDRSHVTAPWVALWWYVSDHSRCGVPDRTPAYTTVFWTDDPATGAPTAPADAKEDFNILDPTAKDPHGCFNDTSGL